MIDLWQLDLAISEMRNVYFLDNLENSFFVSYQISVERCKETLFEQQLKGFDLGIHLKLGGQFKTFLQLSTVKQTLGATVPGIRCHESLVTCFTAQVGRPKSQ